MLINIDPILSPEILHTLRSMGHGDKLILSDSNFPAYSMNSRVHRLDGVNAARAAKAILWTIWTMNIVFLIISMFYRQPLYSHKQ